MEIKPVKKRKKVMDAERQSNISFLGRNDIDKKPSAGSVNFYTPLSPKKAEKRGKKERKKGMKIESSIHKQI